MRCAATLSGGPLVCQRDEGHASGHVFASLGGSDVPDRHDATSGGEH